MADRSALPNAQVVGRIYPPIHSSIRAAPMADRSALPNSPIVGRIYPPIHSSIRAAPMADKSALPNAQSAKGYFYLPCRTGEGRYPIFVSH